LLKFFRQLIMINFLGILVLLSILLVVLVIINTDQILAG
ncbi:MAG: hypothetical protein ACI9EW_003997, partial [Cellvibrionaceae bacterium]